MCERAGKSGQVRLRCAVYTRKSSEEGLDQQFNSLDAQREACDAYVASQRHEGWTLLRARYDDGGFSGGTMQRPALVRLLADIAAERIDVVVVYKVDRLTRSLGDFVRIVELFDRHGVSFVSVTQAFNTTTSMGRLTLNVLLSFAQFEREVTGERIRDKIAASKRKGLWMGGHPALGYDVANRKLVVNEAEADTVRRIFRRYCELRSVRELRAELDAAGVVSKRRVAADRSAYGGQPFSAGALYALLQNRLYVGEIVHKGMRHPGEQHPIVDVALFDAVQATLAANRVRSEGYREHEPSLLAGLLHDVDSERLTPSHMVKKGVRYRYYVSRRLIIGAKPAGSGSNGAGHKKHGLRLPASGIEAHVENRITALLGDPAELVRLAGDQFDRIDFVAAAARKGVDWPSLSLADRRLALLTIVSRIVVRADRLDISLWPDRLVASVMGERVAESNDPDAAPVVITAPVRLQQRGQEMRLMFGDRREATPGHPALLRLLGRAHAIKHQLFTAGATIDEVAQREGVMPSYVTRLVRLAFLSPDIVGPILAGRHDAELTVTRLMADTRIPLDWAEQRRIFASA